VVRVALVVPAVASALIGCTHTTAGPPNAGRDQERQLPPPTAQTSDGAAAKLLWQQSFALPKGPSARWFEITAPDPALHSFEVRVRQQPPAAHVRVRLETSYGDLSLFDFDPNAPPFVSDLVHCEEQEASRACLTGFPPLAAEPAGRWVAVIEKVSDPAAEVRVELEFSPVEAGGAATEGSDEGLETRQRFDSNGIAFDYPSTWFATVEPLSPVGSPVYRFAVSSVPVQRTPADEGPCLPGVARQLPPDAVLAYLREALGVDRTRSLPRLPDRPPSFPLPSARGSGLCGFERGSSLWYPFKDGDRAFYLGVYIGPEASDRSRSTLADLLNKMKIRVR
jgi:hypothetical protein